MAPDKSPGVIGKLVGAVAKSDRLAALKARFASRDPHEIERALAVLGLTCGDYTPAEPDDPILHHLLPEMFERLKIDGDAAWEDANFMQKLRKACYGCPAQARHRCRVWLGWEEAEDDYHECCPNAGKLDSLPRKEQPPPLFPLSPGPRFCHAPVFPPVLASPSGDTAPATGTVR